MAERRSVKKARTVRILKALFSAGRDDFLDGCLSRGPRRLSFIPTTLYPGASNTRQDIPFLALVSRSELDGQLDRTSSGGSNDPI